MLKYFREFKCLRGITTLIIVIVWLVCFGSLVHLVLGHSFYAYIYIFVNSKFCLTATSFDTLVCYSVRVFLKTDQILSTSAVGGRNDYTAHFIPGKHKNILIF
jgi:hypothetical protein